jgi:hypothetical protein
MKYLRKLNKNNVIVSDVATNRSGSCYAYQFPNAGK